MSSAIDGWVYCDCGKKAVLKTSWTDDNPARRFYSCFDYQRIGKGKKGCGFFAWMDSPMCHRSKAVIPGLLRSLNAKEKELQNKEKELQFNEGKRKTLVKALMLSWCVFGIYVLWSCVLGGFG